jgi:hypothetical protein
MFRLFLIVLSLSLSVLALGLGLLIYRQLPDIQRYMRIRAM